jgi:hypothetical protein
MGIWYLVFGNWHCLESSGQRAKDERTQKGKERWEHRKMRLKRYALI